MKPIKVVQIGNLHDHHHLNFQAMVDHPEYFDVLGVTEMSPERDGEYEGVTHLKLEDVLAMDDLDAVVIEAGKENEVKYAQMFADKGVNVFLDKPGSSDLSSYEKLLETVEEKKLAFGLGYVYRFNPAVRRAYELYKNGELGDITSVEAHMSVRHDTEKRKWLGRYKGGALYFLGCHLVDMVCLFCGFPKNVIPLSRSTHNEGLDTEDFGFAVMEYDNGVSTVKVNSSEINGFDRRQIVITGTKGTFEIRPTEVNVENYMLVSKAKVTLTNENPWGDASENYVSEPYNRYAPMLIQFAKQVRGEEGYFMPLDYELELFKTILGTCGADGEAYVPRIKG